jgi:hypothetical protein
LNLPSLPFAKFIELTGFSTPLACWEDSLVQSWMVRFVNKVEQVARHVERPEKSAPVLMRASNESFFFFFLKSYWVCFATTYLNVETIYFRVGEKEVLGLIKAKKKK